MIVRTTQLNEMSRAAEANFVMELLQLFSAKYPSWKGDEPDSAKQIWIKQSVNYARQFGISSSAGLRLFLDTIISCKLNLPLHEGLALMLHTKGISEAARLEEFFLCAKTSRYSLVSFKG